MPLLTATDPPRQRRVPVWMLILALVVLPLVGLFAWSCYQPVRLVVNSRGIAFGRFSEDDLRQEPTGIPGYGWSAFKLPGGRKTGSYVVAYIWL